MRSSPTRAPVLTGLVIAALAALPVLALGANSDYEAALKASRQKAEALRSYRIEGKLLMESRMQGQESGMQMEADLSAAARLPDRLVSRQEGSMFNLSLGVGPERSWFNLGQMRTCYLAGPRALSREWPEGGGMDLDPDRIFNFYGGLGQAVLPEGLEPVAETGRETLTVGDREIPCQVFRTEGDPESGEGPKEYWYDPQSGLVLKAVMSVSGRRNGMMMEQHMTFVVQDWELNGEVAEDLFAFEPPQGATIVDNLDRLTNPEAMTGQEAPAITFTDLEGEPVSLEDFRGKVVFLDFWATWCGPCKIEMPHIQTLFEELGPGGEVVFIAASSEDKPTITSFIDKYGYTFKVVMVSADDARSKYKASSIPAGFVIDRDGVIRAHMVGAQSEQQLRKALARAGIGG